MRCLAVAALLSACLALFSCSSGPAPPLPGTPKFFWSAAQTAHRAGNYLTVNHNLEALLESQNEFTARAQAWALVVNTGLVHGAMELADAFEAGVKLNPDHPLAFYKQSSECRRTANGAALRSVEIFRAYMQKTDSQVPLDFEYPVSPLEPADLVKVKNGTVITDAEMDTLRQTMMQRGVVYALTRLAGSADESAKVQEMLKTGKAAIPRNRFLLGMAQLFYEQAPLYDAKHIGDPRRGNMLVTEANNALNGIPEDSNVKDLREKIKKMQKQFPVSVT